MTRGGDGSGQWWISKRDARIARQVRGDRIGRAGGGCMLALFLLPAYLVIALARAIPVPTRWNDDSDREAGATCAMALPRALVATLTAMLRNARDLPALWRETGGPR